MCNPRVEKWEGKLNALLRQVDAVLEEEYGEVVPRHPSRLPHGATENPQQDGLFRITAAFTAGFGSQLGRGYVVTIEPVTLATFPQDVWREVEQKACRMIREGLEDALPGRDLKLQRDGDVWKITGDLSLDRS